MISVWSVTVASVNARAAAWMRLVNDSSSACSTQPSTFCFVAPGSIDLLCCHGTLEYVDDPTATLTRIAEVLAPGGHLSLVTAQRVAAVIARAIAGRFDQARAALTSADGRWGDDDPIPRRFDRDELAEMLTRAGFSTLEARGVRLFSDLVPSAFVDSDAERAALLELEEIAAADEGRTGLSGLGAAVHLVARRD